MAVVFEHLAGLVVEPLLVAGDAVHDVEGVLHDAQRLLLGARPPQRAVERPQVDVALLRAKSASLLRLAQL